MSITPAEYLILHAALQDLEKSVDALIERHEKLYKGDTWDAEIPDTGDRPVPPGDGGDQLGKARGLREGLRGWLQRLQTRTFRKRKRTI